MTMLLNVSQEVLLVFLLFTPLERLLPMGERKKILREYWQIDVTYLLFNSVLIAACFLIALNGLSALLSPIIPALLTNGIQTLPFLVEVVIVFLIADLVFYSTHRMLHRVPFLWRFHRVHHSIEHLDTLAAHRVHPIDQVLEAGVPVIVLIVFGFSAEAIGLHLVFYKFHALFIHSSIKGPFGGKLRNFLALQQFHHWHHADKAEAYDKNFAAYFPFIDRLFGTFHLPGDEMPEAYGIKEEISKTYIGQLVEPFRAASPVGDEQHEALSV
ncbi:MAG: sterol desaturase family protein [Hyphomonadaceae bacterium]